MWSTDLARSWCSFRCVAFPLTGDHLGYLAMEEWIEGKSSISGSLLRRCWASPEREVKLTSPRWSKHSLARGDWTMYLLVRPVSWRAIFSNKRCQREVKGRWWKWTLKREKRWKETLWACLVALSALKSIRRPFIVHDLNVNFRKTFMQLTSKS